MMKKSFARTLLVSILMMGSSVSASGDHDPINSSAIAAMKPFNSQYPGRGFDPYQKQIEDHPMAYGLYASAASMLGMVDQAQTAANWLLANPATKNSMGWGLPFAWDAFGDGTINPSTTVYGVTTALAVRGLLDVYAATKNPAYLRAAANALVAYKPYFHETDDGGFFGYSDQPQDQVDTHNISAILMGQYARAATLVPNMGFREIAQKAKKHLDKKRLTHNTTHYWPYSARSERINDLVHATYIVQGYLDYARHLEPDLDVSRELDYLSSFFSGNVLMEFPTHATLPEQLKARPARAWGVGMLLYTLSDAGRIELAHKVVEALPAYQAEFSVFGATPGSKTFVPRHQAHIAFGLARYEAATHGHRAPRQGEIRTQKR